MSESVKSKSSAIHAVRELYRKLSMRERVAVWAVAAGLSLVFLVLWIGSTEPPHRQLHVAPAADGAPALQRLVSRLQAQGIEWREGRSGSGARSIEVPSSDFERAQALLAGDNQPDTSDAAIDWSSPAGFLETQDRLDARLRESNRKRIEQWIAWNENIQTARIVSYHARPSVLRPSRSSDDSAAVMLNLKPGVPCLKPRETDAIRDMVRSAFGMRAEQVSISDNMKNSYPAAAAGEESGRVFEREDRCRALIREEIQQLYRAFFDEDELRVGVMVSLSPSRSSVEKKSMDSEKSFVRPTRSTFERDGEPVGSEVGGFITSTMLPIRIREDITSVPFESYERTLTDIPPGELKGVSIVVHFDALAVERVETARREISLSVPTGVSAPAPLPAAESEARLRSFALTEEIVIQKLFGTFPNVNVVVKVHPFRRSLPEDVATLPQVATPSVPAAVAGESAKLGSAWSPIVAALIAAGALVWTLRQLLLLRRRRLERKREVDAWPRAGSTSTVDADGQHSGTEWHTTPSGRLGVLGSVEDASARVRDRPEVAASVLRLWLSQEMLDPAEEVGRS